MNYASIKKHDIANGTGVRVSLFVSGCRHHCKGCFNPETWDFNYGKPFTEETLEEILTACDHEYIEGLSLLGGDPFEPKNIPAVLSVVTAFCNRFPQKTIWCYTGYLYEDIPSLHEDGETLLRLIDVLVDGEFKIEEKDISLRFCGSRNQRLIDVQKSIKENHVVEWD